MNTISLKKLLIAVVAGSLVSSLAFAGNDTSKLETKVDASTSKMEANVKSDIKAVADTKIEAKVDNSTNKLKAKIDAANSKVVAKVDPSTNK